MAIIGRTGSSMPSLPAATGTSPSDNPVLFIQQCPERIVSVSFDRVIGLHRWKHSTPERHPPFLFEIERGTGDRRRVGGSSDARKRLGRRIGVHFGEGLTPSAKLFALAPDSRVVVSGGHWDNSFKLSWVETGRTIQSICHHKDVVSCVAIGPKKQVVSALQIAAVALAGPTASVEPPGEAWVVTGSRDTTVSLIV